MQYRMEGTTDEVRRVQPSPELSGTTPSSYGQSGNMPTRAPPVSSQRMVPSRRVRSADGDRH